MSSLPFALLLLVAAVSFATYSVYLLLPLANLRCTGPEIEIPGKENQHTQNDAESNNKPSTKKNILLLLTDDQDVELGSFDTQSYMPKLHSFLKQQGITFEKGALVHVPICCPSRSSLLTGKYLHNKKVGGTNTRESNQEDNLYRLAVNNSLAGNCYGDTWRKHTEKEDTIAVYAKAAGYTTLYAGKYLNQYKHSSSTSSSGSHSDIDPDSIPAGWDYWYGLEGNSRYYNYTIVERTPNPENEGTVDNDGRGGTIRLHAHGDSYPGDYLPLVLKDYTLSTLPGLTEPWLAVVAWPTPHGPFTPEPKHAGDYPDVAAPRTPNWNASGTGSSPSQRKHWLLRQLGAISERTASQIDAIYRNRLRALATVDDHVGALVEWLGRPETNASSGSGNATSDESENKEDLNTTMLDRTVIMYTSDNGFQFGQHRLAIDKRHLYEHDVRVPFVVRGPFGSGAKSISVPQERIISLVDIAPTMLDIFLEAIQHNDDNNNTDASLVHRLRGAMDRMDGVSFWDFLRTIGGDENHLPMNTTRDYHNGHKTRPSDPFLQRNDLLIAYHGEGDPRCGLSECPAPLNGLWWMPDSYNNTYHCVRTMTANAIQNTNQHSREGIREDAGAADASDSRATNSKAANNENSIYCVFYDNEDFVEYYDLNKNPFQLGNDYHTLSDFQVQRYEKRLQELLS